MDRDFILAPQVVTISVVLEPAYAMLDSLSMLNYVDEYPGLDPWMPRTAAALPAERMYRNRLVFDAFYHAFLGTDESWANIPALVEAIKQADAEKLVDGVIKGLAEWCSHYPNAVTLPPREQLISSYEIFVDLIRNLRAQKEHEKELEPLSEEFLQDWFRGLNEPEWLRSVLVEHLSYMWEHILKSEWKRVEPMLVESVEAFQKLDFSGMSPIEAGRVITGRDMSSTWIGDTMKAATLLRFVPCPHIGPYVSLVKSPSLVRIMFRPRMPEGKTAKSPQLNRSELLVRLSALADDTRLRILELLSGHEELCAQDIIEMLDLSQSAASRHLRHLSATGYLVERRVEGAKCYQLNKDTVEHTMQALPNLLQVP